MMQEMKVFQEWKEVCGLYMRLKYGKASLTWRKGPFSFFKNFIVMCIQFESATLEILACCHITVYDLNKIREVSREIEKQITDQLKGSKFSLVPALTITTQNLNHASNNSRLVNKSRCIRAFKWLRALLATQITILFTHRPEDTH